MTINTDGISQPMATSLSRAVLGLACMAAAALATAANAPGVTATEIKLGQTTSYSGPAASFGKIAMVEQAYFKMINDKGGINGRKVVLVSLDDGYNPARSMAQARKLVEHEHVALMFNSFGAPTNAAQARYLNQNAVPQLFVGTGGVNWGNHQALPWSMGWQVSFRAEGRVFARHILASAPQAKVAILYQNDDFGRDYVDGVKDVLGSRAATMLVRQSYETTDPTIDSQIISLQGAGADHLIIAAVPKFAAQALRKAQDLGWRAHVYIAGGAAGVAATTEPVMGKTGLTIVSGGAFKDFLDPARASDASLADYRAFFKAYLPAEAPQDFSSYYGYSLAATMVQVLEQCGENLSRANIMAQAANLRQFSIATLRDGVTLQTSPLDHYPIEQIGLMQWDGKKWSAFGGVLDAAHGH